MNNQKIKLINIGIAFSSFMLYQSAMAETLRIATDSGAKGSDAGNAIEEWAKKIEEKTDGEIELDVFYQNELGGQQEVFDLLMMGEVDLMLNWPMTTYDSRVALIYTPYMFSSWEDALHAYDEGAWLNQSLQSIYSDLGLAFLGAWPEGFNGIATKDGHATTIDQANDFKVRVPPVFPFSETVSALGYQTATIDWGELYSAIQTGVVDGDAANVIFYDYAYFRDLLTDYVLTRQQFITGILTANESSLDRLSPAHREAIVNSAKEVMNDRFNEAQLADEGYVQKWKELGHNYINLSESELHNYAAIVRDKVWPMMEKNIGPDLMEIVKENAFPINVD